MIYNTASVFPYDTDNLLFVSDPTLEKIEIMEEQQQYISNGEYTKAAELVKNNIEIVPVNADLVNALQNRTISLQEYLKENSTLNVVPVCKDIFSMTKSTITPVKSSDGYYWIDFKFSDENYFKGRIGMTGIGAENTKNACKIAGFDSIDMVKEFDDSSSSTARTDMFANAVRYRIKSSDCISIAYLSNIFSLYLTEVTRETILYKIYAYNNCAIDKTVHSPLEPASIVSSGLCWTSDYELI